jgi:hypothetical protein
MANNFAGKSAATLSFARRLTDAYSQIMQFWMTKHWPKRKIEPLPWHIFLRQGMEPLGRTVQIGDKVLFFETKIGKVAVAALPDGKRYWKTLATGRQGIVASAVVSGPMKLRDLAESNETYTTGERRIWSWEIPTAELNGEGFVPRSEVNRLLGHAKNYALMGFGDRVGGESSGLKQIDESIFNELNRMFLASSTSGS